ncbi:hypothetical protein BBO99_00004923 [Phytophthora kernoviae]|uniref:Uncharacterized protein n=2 Tax=Phytophthora kernoviae TaxID=325452 RepID=A0A3R7MRB6_9STRA|nr:hypothetical protein G195_006585 [Phytophthora kernoviae 00238/432]KAG2524165.1 hypothetical protein JM16_002612 [Phytophthora kernoviae]KAG2524660.1 hypothetical protein JM18_005210 [Phytophthora kernoviae]RLN26342.1 hypothetical protein BBI17_006138 [Phytophthora kernoviae]RLN79891.1 hypothetical protein BBO99_00004923 [Phytophthora kernoviae]
MLYSQLHAPDTCLKITTTSKSNGILHVQLRIDPDSEETAVVRKVAHFVVNEDHQEFSGTEMRLSIPCPKDILDVESAADVLALYFQSLRYTAPPFVGVEFKFDVASVTTSVDCPHQEEPIDRFVDDLGAGAGNILYAHHDEKLTSISCVALMLGDTKPDRPSEIEICLLRYANHAPLINGDDFFLCGITKGELFLNLPTRIRQSGPVKTSISYALSTWKTSGRWLWVLSTTMLVTLVPLSIEMLREEQTNEVVKELVSKGFSYNQIQGMGYMVSQPQSTLAAPAEGATQ